MGSIRRLWASGAVSGTREPLGGLTPARRGPKSRPVNPLATELASAQRRKTPSSGAVWERGRGNHRSPKKTCRSTRNPVGADRARDRARQHALTEGLASAMPVKGTVSATYAALGLSRASLQRSTKHANPVRRPLPLVTAQPSQSVAGRVAANCARSAPFAPLCRSGTGRNLRHLARRGASTTARSAPCIAFSCRQQRSSRPPQATSAIRSTRNRNCWRCAPMRSGRGTLQNSRGRQNGLTSTFKSSSTSLAAALSWLVCRRCRKRLPVQGDCSTTPSPSIKYAGPTHPACRPRQPDEERRRPRSCLPISASPNRTAGRIPQTTKSVLGKSLQDPEISANLSVLLWLHGGC